LVAVVLLVDCAKQLDEKITKAAQNPVANKFVSRSSENRDRKAALKTPQSKRSRDLRSQPEFAKCLDCGDFSTALAPKFAINSLFPYSPAVSRTARRRR
jgi:hypothetical protein